MWSTGEGSASLTPKSLPSRRALPKVDSAPCPVIPSHSASRKIHCMYSEFARVGEVHFNNSERDSTSGSISGFSAKTLRVIFLSAAIVDLSNSGPSAATFLPSPFPISPATLEVCSHKITRLCQRSSGSLLSQASKAIVGRIWSSVSMTINPAR